MEALYKLRNNKALTMVFLRNHQAHRCGAELARGHPVYERIRAEVLAEAAAALPSGDETPHELNQMPARKQDMARMEEAELDEAETDVVGTN